MQIKIRAMLPQDWQAVSKIFRDGIKSGNATFETEIPDWENWDAAHLPHSRLIALHGNEITGWAALSPVTSRCVYAGVAEVSIYVLEKTRRQGVGKALLERLIIESELNGIWTLQAGIFFENEPSLSLFKRCGFRLVGIRERIGKMGNDWRDIQLLERRSNIVGL